VTVALNEFFEDQALFHIGAVALNFFGSVFSVRRLRA